MNKNIKKRNLRNKINKFRKKEKEKGNKLTYIEASKIKLQKQK